MLLSFSLFLVNTFIIFKNIFLTIQFKYIKRIHIKKNQRAIDKNSMFLILLVLNKSKIEASSIFST